MKTKTTLLRYVTIFLMVAPLLAHAGNESTASDGLAGKSEGYVDICSKANLSPIKEVGTIHIKGTLNDDNAAPVITGFTGDIRNALLWGETVSIQTEAFDPDGDSLTFSATDIPPGLSIDPESGEIAGCLDIERSGGSTTTFYTTVTATDPHGSSDTDTLFVLVGQPYVESYTLIDADTNLPIPGYDPIPPTNSIALNSVGTNLNIRVNPLWGVPLTCGVAVEFELDGAPFNTENFFPFALAGDLEGDYYSWTPSVGEHTVAAQVISQEAGVPYYGWKPKLTLNVTLERINQAPEITRFMGGIPRFWGQEVDMQAIAQDPNADPLTFSATGLPPGLSIDPDSGKITGCLSLDSGQGSSTGYSVSVKVTDHEGLSDTKTLDFFILHPSVTSFTLIDADTDLPVPGYELLDASNSTIDLGIVGSNLNIRANTDLGAVCGGAVKFELDGTPFRTENFSPYALAGDLEGDYYSWTPTEGEHTISAKIISMTTGFSFYGPFSISIDVVLEGSNHAPEIGSFLGNVPDFWGVEATIRTEASDPDNDPLTYSATGLPPDLSIDPNSGKITGCLSLDSGQGSSTSYSATITATDNEGLSDSKTLDFFILHPSVTSFTLIDADTDLPVLGYEVLDTSNNTIDLDVVGSNLNIRANTDIGPVCGGAVKFELDGANFRTENFFPYALAGDFEGDYYSWTPTEGEHTITAEIISKTTGYSFYGPSSLSITITSSSSKTAQKTVQLYPNPSSDFIQVHLANSQKGRFNYRVVGLGDQRTLLEGFVTEDNNLIDVGSLQKGLYIVELSADEGTFRKHLKLLKD